jgi:hypothetical protein
MPLNMKPPFAHSNVAAVEGAWPVMGFTSHQQMHCEPPSRSYCWVLSLLSPAPLRSVRTTPPLRTPEIDSSEVGQRAEHMVRLGIHRKFWSEFLCLGGYLAPARQVGWGGACVCVLACRLVFYPRVCLFPTLALQPVAMMRMS